jgi:hypothetical protein
MNESLVIRTILLVVPFVAGMSVFGMLRQRGVRGTTAGCAAIAAGLLLSFTITGVILLNAIR